MSKKSFVLRNLSVTLFIIIYLCLVVIHFTNDGFILENQLGLIATLLPFILYGLILDYLGHRNKSLESWIRVIAQLLPLGIFIMQIVSTIYLYLGKNTYDIFNYMIWLFLTVPLFIVCYDKEAFRSRLTKTAIGMGAYAVVYVYLTTLTKNLNGGYGAIIYFIAYFMMLYLASGIKKLPYLGTIIGIVNAVLLLLLRYFPMTADAKTYGWDSGITFQVELFIIISFVICTLIRLVIAFRTKEV